MANVGFGVRKKSDGDDIIEQLVNYICKQVSFAKLARAYSLPYEKNHNFTCWFHSDSTPSARVKIRHGKEFYGCFAQCPGGDVVWVVKQLEDLPSMGRTIEFMDDYFGLDLALHIPEILGFKRPPSLYREVIRGAMVKCVHPVEWLFSELYHSIPKVTQFRLAGDVENLWRIREAIDEAVGDEEPVDSIVLRVGRWFLYVSELSIRMADCASQDIDFKLEDLADVS